MMIGDDIAARRIQNNPRPDTLRRLLEPAVGRLPARSARGQQHRLRLLLDRRAGEGPRHAADARGDAPTGHDVHVDHARRQRERL